MKYKIIILISVIIFLCGITGSAFVLLSPPKKNVNIIQDGTVLYTIDLSKEKDRSFIVEYNGSSNTIEIKDGRIRVSDAECPDKTCVHTGWLSSSAMPIVCLPNHLIIEYDDENSDIDAMTE